MMDLVLITCSIVAGGLCSIIVGNVLHKGVNGSKSKTSSFQNSYPQMGVEELESLKIEKIILEENMVKIYEAYKNHMLPKLEFDRLRTKYTEDIYNCNERFQHLQTFVDIAELKELRKDLVSLLETKIKNIDEKLNKVSSQLPTDRLNETESVQFEGATQTKFSKQIRRTAALEQAKIGKLNEEILDAVADIDSASKAGSSINSKNNQIKNPFATERASESKSRERDALSNLD